MLFQIIPRDRQEPFRVFIGLVRGKHGQRDSVRKLLDRLCGERDDLPFYVMVDRFEMKFFEQLLLGFGQQSGNDCLVRKAFPFFGDELKKTFRQSLRNKSVLFLMAWPSKPNHFLY